MALGSEINSTIIKHHKNPKGNEIHENKQYNHHDIAVGISADPLIDKNANFSIVILHVLWFLDDV